jgi:hypothetical protein
MTTTPPAAPLKKSFARRMARVVGVLILAPYLALVGIVTIAQRALIYHPKRDMTLNVRPTQILGGVIEPISFTATDGVEIHGWQVSADKSSTPRDGTANPKTGKPVVLYFCGNAGHRGYRIDEFSLLLDAGADVVCFDYRGYGDNLGSPSEETLASDARKIWDFLVDERHVEPGSIVICGESLGGGVATRLAAELCACNTPPAGLVLRSTFSRLTDAAAIHFPWLPVRWLLVDRFSSVERIPQVTCPILILHGLRDTIVPYELGRKLFDAAPEKSAAGAAKRFVDLPNSDHNDVLEVDGALVKKALRELIRSIPERD